MRSGKILLLISFILTSFYCSAQKDWEKFIKENPKTAAAEAQKMYEEALAVHNTPAVIQALLIKLRSETLIDNAAFPSLLSQVEDLIVSAVAPAEKAILHSLTAELYQLFYNNNRFSIDQRTALNGEIPANPETWSANIFIEKIFSHALAALQEKATLQKIPVTAYQLLLIPGKDSPVLRPTLYDFLVFRSIGQLTALQQTPIGSYYAQKKYTSSEALLPLKEFIRTPVSVSPYDVKSNVLNIYRNLLAFRSGKNDPAALLIDDINRLEYAQRIAPSDSIFHIRMLELAQEFRQSPYIVEVMASNARYYLQKGEHEKALQLARQGIDKFPHYQRINLLKQIIQQVETPQLSLHFPSTVYPGTPLPLQVNFYNLSHMELKLFRITETTARYNQKRKDSLPYEEELILQKKYVLPQNFLSRDTTFRLTVSQSGLYKLIITTPRQKPKEETFVVTRLYTTVRQDDHRLNFMVRDAQSGKPVKNARILFYSGFPYTQETGQLTTNISGMASYFPPAGHKTTKPLYYEVINTANPNGMVCQHYYYDTRSLSSVVSEELFTDRKIYRPGQTIQYSGLIWTTNADSNRVNVQKPVTVTLWNANHQKVRDYTTYTNEWGSFSGTFVIPRETLNGLFSLQVNHKFATTVEVADYKKPEIEISFTPQKKLYTFGDTVITRGKLQTYSGLPLSHTAVSYQVTLHSFYRRNPLDNQTFKGVTTTDSEGHFLIRFGTEKPAQSLHPAFGNYYYEITATAVDTKGETAETSTRINITTSSYTYSIEMEEYADKNRPIPVHIQTWGNTAQTVRPINYTVSLLAPLEQLGQSYHPDSLTLVKTILKDTFNAATDTLFLQAGTWEPGAYLLQINPVEKINKATAQKIFYIYSLQDQRPPILTYNWFIPLKIKCKPGENAEILLGTSADDVHVLFDLSGPSGQLEQVSFQLSNETRVISIPYHASYGNQIQASFSFVKDGKFFQNTTPIYKRLKNKELVFKTRTFRDKLLPGQEELWEFTLTHENRPVQAEVMAVMYDRALDKFRPNNWNFTPAPYLAPVYPEWQNSIFYTNRSIWFNFHRPFLSVPDFSFNRLNLFGLEANYAVHYALYEKEEMAVSDAGHPVYSRNTYRKQSMAPLSALENPEYQGTFSPIRQNFAETAFFYPQLTSSAQGDITLRFKVPEAITGWKFMALAHTQDMDYGYMEKEVVTLRNLMVSPNLPQFFRSGDSTVIQARISNQTATQQDGVARLDLFEPGSNRILLSRQISFHIPPKESVVTSFGFYVPQNFSVLGCRITANTATFSDGEQQLIAVAPDRILVTDAMPFYTSAAGSHTYSLKQHPQEPYRLTLEVTSNPVWYAVLAIPSLQHPQNQTSSDLASAYYINAVASAIVRSNPRIKTAIESRSHTSGTSPASPLQQNEELKSILLQVSPWADDAQNETEQMQSLQELFDLNRLAYLQEQLSNKLRQLQNTDGGWSWFPDMSSNPFITCRILQLLSRIPETAGQEFSEKEKMMQLKALRYLDNKLKKEYKQTDSTQTPSLHSQQILYLYVRSHYPDIPLGDALEAQKYYLNLAEKQWRDFSFYDKALLACTCYQYGKKETANRILRSLLEYSVTSPDQGMFWPNNRSPFSSVHSAITTQVAIMEAFQKIKKDTVAIDLMKQWLLRQKQAQNWGPLPGTVDAIYALLLTGSSLLDRPEKLTVVLGKHNFSPESAEQPLGYLKKTFTAKQITPSMSRITLKKETNTPSWGALYMQYYAPLKQIQSTETPELKLEKQLFLEKNTETGRELIPLPGKLKTGDKVTIRLTITSRQDMQYMHLQDLRAACFIPARQLSGLRHRNRLSYYEESKEASTNFFFEYLPQGTYVIEYSVWVNQTGFYQDGIATLQCLYAPQFITHSNTQKIQVK